MISMYGVWISTMTILHIKSVTFCHHTLSSIRICGLHVTMSLKLINHLSIGQKVLMKFDFVLHWKIHPIGWTFVVRMENLVDKFQNIITSPYPFGNNNQYHPHATCNPH